MWRADKYLWIFDCAGVGSPTSLFYVPGSGIAGSCVFEEPPSCFHSSCTIHIPATVCRCQCPRILLALGSSLGGGHPSGWELVFLRGVDAAP